VHSALQELAPVGLVDVDCQLPDEQLADYMRAVVAAFRAFEPTHPLRLNITPNKHGFLPADLYANDSNLYAAMQTYYGNMQGRYSEATALAQLFSVGVPLGRAQVVYAAMCDTWDPRAQLWLRTLTLPSLFIGIAYIGPARPIGAGLWLASYARNDGTDHGAAVPPPWRSYVAHQFSSNCLVSGCGGRVDLSHARRLRPLLAHGLRGL
jgi:hypothetical protein